MLVMARGELGMLMVSLSWTKASTGIPESMNASKMGVPKAFQVSIERSMCGLFGRGVASALATGPLNCMGGRWGKVLAG